MVLFYSGDCPVCRWLAAHLIPRIDRHGSMAILPFRDPLARQMLASKGVTDIEVIKQSWWFLDAQDKLWKGNRGGLKRLLCSFSHTRKWARFIPSVCCDCADTVVKHSRPLLARWFYSDVVTRRWLRRHRKQAA